MDLQTKLKAYCECEIQRTWYEYDALFARYLQSYSAYDLALATDAMHKYVFTRRICYSILDLIAYHFDTHV